MVVKWAVHLSKLSMRTVEGNNIGVVLRRFVKLAETL